ncbi:UNVERIFIED_CONTAM: hypothetical protein RF648_20045, partial [Kocuria sp. CPCC 205274]
MANTNVVTAENAAVKARISEVVTGYKNSSTAFADLFIGLCERFTGKDSQSGDMLQHLLNSVGDDHKSLRSAVISRLKDFSENTILIEFDTDKKSWSVVTKKATVTGKSLFSK